MELYDLIVIGTGTAAQVAAAHVRKAGRSVAVIDHLPFGGTCALRGCDPKKMLVSGAEAVDWAEAATLLNTGGARWPDAFKRSIGVALKDEEEAGLTKLVLVGMTGLGLLDFQTTPLGEHIPGVEIHAQLLEQMFDGNYLRRPSGASWLEAALLALAGLLLVFAVPALRPWASATALGAALAVLVALGLLAFRAGTLINVAAPAIGAVRAAALAALWAGRGVDASRTTLPLRCRKRNAPGALLAPRMRGRLWGHGTPPLLPRSALPLAQTVLRRFVRRVIPALPAHRNRYRARFARLTPASGAGSPRPGSSGRGRGPRARSRR